jgi:predicted nucleic acid-binding Zn ribbon protein
MSNRKYTDNPLKELISDILRRNGWEHRYQEMEVLRCYREVVGEVIWKKTRESRLHGKTLVLKMDSGPLKQELSYQKTKLIDAINQLLGDESIEKVEVW